MPTITKIGVQPEAISCGDLVDIAVEVRFAGSPRDLTVSFRIQPPCAFKGDPEFIAMKRYGPSPQTFRITERIVCPSGSGQTFPAILVTAQDKNGTDEKRKVVDVNDC